MEGVGGPRGGKEESVECRCERSCPAISCLSAITHSTDTNGAVKESRSKLQDINRPLLKFKHRLSPVSPSFTCLSAEQPQGKGPCCSTLP